MRVWRSRLLISSFASAILFASAPGVFAEQSPSLRELALKERERRNALKVRGKVITEQDLPAVLPVASPPVPAPPTPLRSVSDPPPAVTADEVRTEAWWRQRIGALRDELRRNEVIAEALQSRINALANDVAAVDDPFRRGKLADDRQQAILELERVRAGHEVLKKKVMEIEEDARRSGVPPGWLR